MFKVIAYVTRKPGLSREEFKQGYESMLVPHMRKTFPQIVKYKRNYVDPSVAIIIPGATLPGFDSITEIYFEDRAGFDSMMSSFSDPKVFAVVDDIEAKFLDRTKTCVVMVEETGDKG
jgi:hypothetical protein